jgi:hypothetical protein
LDWTAIFAHRRVQGQEEVSSLDFDATYLFKVGEWVHEGEEEGEWVSECVNDIKIIELDGIVHKL